MQSLNDKYISIQGWMVEELKLKGNDLLVYAIIYGFSQDDESEFTGSLSYLARWCNSTKNGIQKNLKKLIEAKLISKKSTIKNGVKYCSYSCTPYNRVVQGIQQSCTKYTTELHEGIQQSCNNNIDINNRNKTIEDNIDKKNSKKSSSISKLIIETCLKNDIEDDNSIELIEQFLTEMKIKTRGSIEANIAKVAGQKYTTIKKLIDLAYSRNYKYIPEVSWLDDNKSNYSSRLPKELRLNCTTTEEDRSKFKQLMETNDKSLKHF